MHHFSTNVRYLREQRGLKQDQLKEFLGINRTTWSTYEVGRSEPSIGVLISISKFFGVSLDDLLLKNLRLSAFMSAEKTVPPKVLRSLVQPVENELFLLKEPESDLSFILRELKKLRHEVDHLHHRPAK